jgi:hypothetical protein
MFLFCSNHTLWLKQPKPPQAQIHNPIFQKKKTKKPQTHTPLTLYFLTGWDREGSKK